MENPADSSEIVRVFDRNIDKILLEYNTSLVRKSEETVRIRQKLERDKEELDKELKRRDSEARAKLLALEAKARFRMRVCTCCTILGLFLVLAASFAAGMAVGMHMAYMHCLEDTAAPKMARESAPEEWLMRGVDPVVPQQPVGGNNGFHANSSANHTFQGNYTHLDTTAPFKIEAPFTIEAAPVMSSYALNVALTSLSGFAVYVAVSVLTRPAPLELVPFQELSPSHDIVAPRVATSMITTAVHCTVNFVWNAGEMLFRAAIQVIWGASP